MTEAEISGTEMAWTSGQTAARRKTLTDAGMKRPLAETLVDLLDEQAAPMVTRTEADARFKAMLDHHDAHRAQDRAETDARFTAMLERHDAQRAQDRAETDARFNAMLERHDAQRAQDRAEWKGEMETRFAQVDARFAQVDARFAELNGEMQARFAHVDSRFAELRGEMDARFASVEGRIDGLAGQVGTLKWTFGSIMAFNTLLLAVLTYTVAS